MIIAWMVFATIIGLLLTGAALATELLTRALRLPTRLVWGVALLVTIVWPIVARLRVATVGHVHDRGMVPRGATSGMVSMSTVDTSLQTIVSRMVTGDVGRILGNGLLMMWAIVSLILVSRLLWSLWQLHRRQPTWRRAEVDGVAVRLSSDVGPAVIGVRTMEVVLPEWVLAFDGPLRTLILRHEQEHRLAGDPLLLFLTTLVVALVPWNLALWWQLQRLRLAIEVDCDNRVLSIHPQQERYCLLLLALAQRTIHTATPCAPALVESTSHLEQRIIAMRARTLPISHLRLFGVGLVALSAVTLACALKLPARPASMDSATAHQGSDSKVEEAPVPTLFRFGTSDTTHQGSDSEVEVAPIPTLFRFGISDTTHQGSDSEVEVVPIPTLFRFGISDTTHQGSDSEVEVAPVPTLFRFGISDTTHQGSDSKVEVVPVPTSPRN